MVSEVKAYGPYAALQLPFGKDLLSIYYGPSSAKTKTHSSSQGASSERLRQ